MSPEIIYRPAIPKDAEGIVALWNTILWNNQKTFIQAENTPKELVQKIATSASEEEIHVAEHNGNVVGVAMFYDTSSFYIHPEIFSLVASPSSPGTGRILLRKVEELLKARGHEAVILFPSGAQSDRLEAWYTFQKYTKIPHSIFWKKLL